MENTDLAYIAGYFDGEGCITVWKRKPAYTCISPRHILTIQISSTDECGLKWINSQFKGKMLYVHNTKYRYQNADAKSYVRNMWFLSDIKVFNWKWIVQAKRAATILKLILPYLKLKKKEAELAIELQDDMQKHLHEKRTHGKRGIAPLSKDRQEFRDGLMNQIKSLKKSYKLYDGKHRP